MKQLLTVCLAVALCMPAMGAMIASERASVATALANTNLPLAIAGAWCSSTQACLSASGLPPLTPSIANKQFNTRKARRKSYSDLTTIERSCFIEAFGELRQRDRKAKAAGGDFRYDYDGLVALSAVHGRSGDVNDHLPQKGAAYSACSCPHNFSFERFDFPQPAPDKGPMFLFWHRAYIRALEMSLQSVIEGMPARRAAECTPFRLPYWDWTTTAVVPADFRLPRLCADRKDSAISLPCTAADADARPPAHGPLVNPLYEAERNPKANSGLELEDLTQSANPFNTTFSVDFEGFNETLLAGWHNVIHSSVAEEVSGRLMAVPETAAFDPLFWVHHANVDRLFAIWFRNRNAPGHRPVRDYQSVWEREGYAFPVITADGVRRWQPGYDSIKPDAGDDVLGYTYACGPLGAATADPCVALPPLTVPDIPRWERAEKRNVTSCAVDAGMFTTPNVLNELVWIRRTATNLKSITLAETAHPEPLKVGHRLLNLDLRIDPDAAAAIARELSNQDRGCRERRDCGSLFLSVDNVIHVPIEGVGSPVSSYQVFAHLSDQPTAPLGSNTDFQTTYVGTLDLFSRQSDGRQRQALNLDRAVCRQSRSEPGTCRLNPEDLEHLQVFVLPVLRTQPDTDDPLPQDQHYLELDRLRIKYRSRRVRTDQHDCEAQSLAVSARHS